HHEVVDQYLLARRGERAVALQDEVDVELAGHQHPLHRRAARHARRWMTKSPTTRLMTPWSDGESGRRPMARQRKKASSCPTSTSRPGASSSPTGASHASSITRSSGEARSAGMSAPKSTLLLPSRFCCNSRKRSTS